MGEVTSVRRDSSLQKGILLLPTKGRDFSCKIERRREGGAAVLIPTGGESRGRKRNRGKKVSSGRETSKTFKRAKASAHGTNHKTPHKRRLLTLFNVNKGFGLSGRPGGRGRGEGDNRLHR